MKRTILWEDSSGLQHLVALLLIRGVESKIVAAWRRVPELAIGSEDLAKLTAMARSRTEPASRIERAKMLLAYRGNPSFFAVGQALGVHPQTVQRCVERAVAYGPMEALDDRPRPGREPTIPSEARAWLVSLACQKPKDLGYPYELWTTRLLASHAREHGPAEGHGCLARLAQGTVCKILAAEEVKPHKVHYYLEGRDAEFDEGNVVVAIANTASDLPPVPGVDATFSCDHEYKRHGTVSLPARIDLLTGEVDALVEDRHRSRVFIEFGKILDEAYPARTVIHLILDNHSAHISKQTKAWIAAQPAGRLEFPFTPRHGSGLNLVEGFFSKLARSVLRHIRVASKQELKDCIMAAIDLFNQDPVVHTSSNMLEKAA